jgi:hypothetical protein
MPVAAETRLGPHEIAGPIGRALSHPTIPPIHDRGEHGGTPYAVTERLERETWQRRLRAGPPSQRKTAVYAAHVVPDWTALLGKQSRTTGESPA